MYSIAALLLTAALAFGIGAGLGYFLAGRRTPDGRQEAELALDQSQPGKQHEDYQQAVADHFHGAARLLNQMGDSYRQLRDHLATGAAHLRAPDRPSAASPTAPPADFHPLPEDTLPANPDPAPLRPPLDYAPKSSPDATGVLNEKFGLEQRQGEREEA